MIALTTIEAPACPLGLEHVDTDQLIPARFLTLGISCNIFSATRLIKKLPSEMPRSPGWQLLME